MQSLKSPIATCNNIQGPINLCLGQKIFLRSVSWIWFLGWLLPFSKEIGPIQTVQSHHGSGLWSLPSRTASFSWVGWLFSVWIGETCMQSTGSIPRIWDSSQTELLHSTILNPWPAHPRSVPQVLLVMQCFCTGTSGNEPSLYPPRPPLHLSLSHKMSCVLKASPTG